MPTRPGQPAVSASTSCPGRATPSCTPISRSWSSTIRRARRRRRGCVRPGGRACPSSRSTTSASHRCIRPGRRRQPGSAPCRRPRRGRRGVPARNGLRGPAAGASVSSAAARADASRRSRPTILVGLGGGQQAAAGSSIARKLRAELDCLPGLSRARVLLSLGLDSSADSRVVARPAGIEVIPPARFRDALAQATVAVVAGGTTLYEACALGTPVVAVPVVPGQTTTVRRFVRAGLAVGVPGTAGVGTDAWGRAAAVAARDLLADPLRRRGSVAPRPDRDRRAGGRAGGARDRGARRALTRMRTGTRTRAQSDGDHGSDDADRDARHRGRGAAVRHRRDRPQSRR